MSSNSQGSEPRSEPRFLCGHCDSVLSKTQFYKHKRLYYNRRERKWNSDRILPENDHQDFEFGTGS